MLQLSSLSGFSTIGSEVGSLCSIFSFTLSLSSPTHIPFPVLSSLQFFFPFLCCRSSSFSFSCFLSFSISLCFSCSRSSSFFLFLPFPFFFLSFSLAPALALLQFFLMPLPFPSFSRPLSLISSGEGCLSSMPSFSSSLPVSRHMLLSFVLPFSRSSSSRRLRHVLLLQKVLTVAFFFASIFHLHLGPMLGRKRAWSSRYCLSVRGGC